MKLPFGLHNGTFIHISEVTSGRTDALCPYCNHLLIAKKGKLKRHHFAHDGKPCTQHFSNNFFGITGRLPTHLPLSIYARQKMAKINAYFKELTIKQEAFLNKKEQKAILVPELKQELMALAEQDKTGSIQEIYQQLELFLGRKIALFPEFHLIRSEHFTEGYTDGKRTCSFEEVHKDQYEYYYPIAFEKYVQFLKTVHQGQYEFAEITHKISLFKKDLAYFNKFDLYFLEVIVDDRKLYKIGLTSRDIAVRMEEIKQDLKKYFLRVQLKVLFTKNGLAFLETFFKQKQEGNQFKIGRLTEYFTFSDQEVQIILRDLNASFFDKMPDRAKEEWVEWIYSRFNGKMYGHHSKSVYVDGQRFYLTQKEEERLSNLLGVKPSSF